MLPDAASPVERLELADWRRQVADVYAAVRRIAAFDPEEAWRTWRDERERLYLHHPQSPLPAAARRGFTAQHWPYDSSLRYELMLVGRSADRPADSTALPLSSGGEMRLAEIGQLDVPFPTGTRSLAVFSLDDYAGGLILPFLDATNGAETYRAGRYLLDTAKGADLGGDPRSGTIVVDFNFAFQPSCAYDARWSCPLAPQANRLDFRIEAGERLT
ncbi:MAG TPA: DUF1684 domain-containing protein [Candidatus Deferrimicrobiaceae bacterium]|nr:DUF1684 domain-containing protein [Candidatus Deferrimicrobiaceae bacterium]